ncbi:hypothetical protein [Nocardia sp. NPDC059691]|uniref:hypothetical protein n=1 Tax=Nocardia sp. NPDC059691 TaxID=3346908 RepID=UPI0036B5B9D0
MVVILPPRGRILTDQESTKPGAVPSVLTLRATRSAVYERGNELDGREAAVAEHGGLLVTHLLFQYLGATSIDDPDFDWESEVLEKVPTTVEELVRRLAHQITLDEHRPLIRATFQSAKRCQELAKQVLDQMADGIAVPEPPAKQRKPRRQNTVPLLVDRRVIKEGSALHYVAQTEPERKALENWLAKDERRRQATWVNHRTKSILWAYDEQQYSPSGLVSKMWWDAGWDDRPVANQGTMRWLLGDGRSLWDLAQLIHSEEDEPGDDES